MAKPIPSHPCQGGCGKIVSGNKRKCLACIDKEIAFRKIAEQYGMEIDS